MGGFQTLCRMPGYGSVPSAARVPVLPILPEVWVCPFRTQLQEVPGAHEARRQILTSQLLNGQE